MTRRNQLEIVHDERRTDLILADVVGAIEDGRFPLRNDLKLANAEVSNSRNLRFRLSSESPRL